MQKWEYANGYYEADYDGKKQIAAVGSKTFQWVTDMLNWMGDEGWELVSVTTVAQPKMRLEYFYFKRPKA